MTSQYCWRALACRCRGQKSFANYTATYGAIGGVTILMLWFYISGLAIPAGAEMNAEIEHASPYGKDKGEKVPDEKRGRAA